MAEVKDAGVKGGELIPRVAWEDFPEGLKAALKPKVDRLGYCGEIWQVGANLPKSMLSFCNMTEDLKDEMPMKLVELTALTVAGVMGNTYEKNQHERLADKLGYGREWIADVGRLNPTEATVMSDDEKKVQKFIIAAIYRRGHDSRALFEDAAKAIGAKAAVGVLLSIGRCIQHAIFRNVLELAPPVTSVFEGKK
ncbi:MAG: hypothetical protein ACM30I_15060 [Gemmatimonas sp.]